MDYFFSLILIILLQLKIVLSSEFSLELVNEDMRQGTFISPTLSEDGYLYIVTGEDELINNICNRYYLIFDTKNTSIIAKLYYETSQTFWSGEVYSFIDKSQFLFMSSFSGVPKSGSFSVKTVRGPGHTFTDTTIYGFRRSFKKAGSYYYFMHLDYD